MKRTRFLALREEIRERRRSPQEQRSCEVGKRRQDKMTSFLQELKEEEGGIINDFLQAGDLSYQDIVEGIDFFVVVVDGAYKFCPLSVTGEEWLEEHKRRHPEIPVICIAESDTTASVKSKIMEAINHR